MVLWSAFKPCFFSSEWVHFRSWRLISRMCTVPKVSFTLYTLAGGYYFHICYDRVQAADTLFFSKQKWLPHVWCRQYSCIQTLSTATLQPLFWGLGMCLLADSHGTDTITSERSEAFCPQAKIQTVTPLFFTLPLPGYRPRCRRTQQHCGLFHHASRSSQCVWHRPKHWGNQAEILYPFSGHHPQHHKK